MHTRRPFWLCILFTIVLFGAACGGSDDDAGDDDTNTTESDSGSTGSTSDDDDGSGGADGSDPSEDGAEGDDGPDNDDAAEILGDPDLDLEDLPDEAADAIDDIDDIVSIGDCGSEVVGLAITAPDGWVCRVLDVALGGMDGFTLFTEGNELNITIGTPSPLAACEVLQACDTAEDITLSGQWPDTQRFEIAGTVTIWGRHATVEAEVIITKLTEITDEEYDLIRTVLDSTMEVG